MPGELEKTLPCKLTREELEHRSQEMASVIQEIDEMEEAEKARKKSAKAEIEELRASVARYAEEVSSGVTRREVRCEERRNGEAGSMEIIRLDEEACWPDGKNLVSSRPLKPAEQQISMLDDHRRDRDGESEDEEGTEIDGEADDSEEFDAEAALE